jgi:hypothetical protein
MFNRKRVVVAGGILLLLGISIAVGMIIFRPEDKQESGLDPAIYEAMKVKEVIRPTEVTSLEKIVENYNKKDYAASLDAAKAYLAAESDPSKLISMSIMCIKSAKALNKTDDIEACKQKAAPLIAALTDQAAKDGWTAQLSQALGTSTINSSEGSNATGPN